MAPDATGPRDDLGIAYTGLTLAEYGAARHALLYPDPAPARRKPLRVRVAFVIDVDTAAWQAEYASDETPAEIRAAVRGMAADALQSAGFAHLIPDVLTVREG